MKNWIQMYPNERRKYRSVNDMISWPCGVGALDRSVGLQAVKRCW